MNVVCFDLLIENMLRRQIFIYYQNLSDLGLHDLHAALDDLSQLVTIYRGKNLYSVFFINKNVQRI